MLRVFEALGCFRRKRINNPRLFEREDRIGSILHFTFVFAFVFEFITLFCFPALVFLFIHCVCQLLSLLLALRSECTQTNHAIQYHEPQDLYEGLRKV